MTLGHQKSIYCEMGKKYILLFPCFFANWVLSLWPLPNISYVSMIQNNQGCRAIQNSISIPEWNPISGEQDSLFLSVSKSQTFASVCFE